MQPEKKMEMRRVAVTRTPHRLLPDPRRVITKQYFPGEEMLLVLDPMPPRFTCDELEHAIASLDPKPVPRSIAYETIKIIHWLATSNYIVAIPRESAISERESRAR